MLHSRAFLLTLITGSLSLDPRVEHILSYNLQLKDKAELQKSSAVEATDATEPILSSTLFSIIYPKISTVAATMSSSVKGNSIQFHDSNSLDNKLFALNWK